VIKSINEQSEKLLGFLAEIANDLVQLMRIVGVNGSADGSIHISIVITWITWFSNGASIVDPHPCLCSTKLITRQ
jgi:hypothetical protein